MKRRQKSMRIAAGFAGASFLLSFGSILRGGVIMKTKKGNLFFKKLGAAALAVSLAAA